MFGNITLESGTLGSGTLGSDTFESNIFHSIFDSIMPRSDIFGNAMRAHLYKNKDHKKKKPTISFLPIRPLRLNR